MNHPTSLPSSTEYRQLFDATTAHLQTKQQVLFLTTSNRWSGERDGDQPKSTQLAYALAKRLALPTQVTVIEVPTLNIYPCEGNVSTARGNTCGLLKAALKDPAKNPSGQHRCWASINNPDDELWKISCELLAADAVVFFGSVRWGQMNSFYQKLIERLTWLENRHSTFGEENIVGHIDAGVIAVGQNWRGADVIQNQKQVLGYFGFTVVDALCWNWQYTTATEDERPESYQEGAQAFAETFLQ